MVLEPLRSPIGFGTADWIEFGVAVCLLFVMLERHRIEPLFRRLAEHKVWCMLLLGMAPVALRLILLSYRPVPTPDVYDEFGHLLVADTLRHFRLANPTHPLQQFFETFFVLQTPSYSSIYPLGQGMMLALGRAMFGLPWAGVLLASSALSAAVYWMLRAWTTPLWALIGGLLAVAEFGPLSPWMNNYWGGSLAAFAGCLVFGALPRLLEYRRLRDGFWLGVGLSIHWFTRPFESIFLLAGVGLFFAFHGRVVRAAWPAIAVVLPAAALTLLHNQQVTGSCWTLPYQLSQYQYGVPSSLTFEANPVPHRTLTPQQELGYKMQTVAHGPRRDSPVAYVRRLVYRARFYRFFFTPPLYIAALAFLLGAGQTRFLWTLATIALFALGENLYPYFQPHYVAALTSLFLLVSVVGLQSLARWSGMASLFVLTLCGAYFTFWYGAQFHEDSSHSGPQRRIAVRAQLAALPGKQLVFVRYWPNHVFQDEWVYNEADIDGGRVVWARDLGAQENEKLCKYYPDRMPWLLEPDEQPPSLSAYQSEQVGVANEPAQAHPAEPEKQAPKPKPLQPTLRFEEVK